MEIRQAELAHMEVTGDFLFKYLCSIHKQLFQFEDLYRKLKKEYKLTFPGWCCKL